MRDNVQEGVRSSATDVISWFFFKLFKKLRLRAVKGSQVHPTSKLESGTAFYSSTMDRHSFCGYDCDISCADIGSFTSIANGVVIGGGRHPWNGLACRQCSMRAVTASRLNSPLTGATREARGGRPRRMDRPLGRRAAGRGNWQRCGGWRWRGGN